MEWFSGTPELFDFYNAVWDGVDFDGQGKAEITYNDVPGFTPGGPDIGTATYQAACPELDSHPCLKIDFTTGGLPRFYYTRKVSSTTFLTFVHMQDGSGTYSDVNVLELKSSRQVASALAPVSLSAASPSSCADKGLDEVKAAAADMDSANAFQCFKDYFDVLGRAQTEEELTSLVNTAGAYAGNMEWFSGTPELFDFYNAV